MFGGDMECYNRLFYHYEPGVYVVLSDTGNIEHLKAKIVSFAQRLIGPTTRERLAHSFHNVNSTRG